MNLAQSNCVRTPGSLRFGARLDVVSDDNNVKFVSRPTVTMACLVAAGSISQAEAQQAPLPPVTVDAPVTRPRPPAGKPTPEQLRVRAALRRQAQQARDAARQAALANTNAPAPDRNPYADPNAPYKADRLASPKFTEPLLDTPKTVTVLTKEVLDDKNATSLKEVARTTAGVTLGTGEGGNAFGDRFFIRGFDARNDIFVDGVRDPAVSIRENFFTEQVEILRGPASSFAGRGTTGGAINIVTKQATDQNFYDAESTIGTDRTKRITLDVNQVINPTLSVRFNAMGQDAGVAGRDYVFDDRWGLAGAVKWTPSDVVKVTANYMHTDLNALPDFGVPYDKPALAPYTDVGVPRNTYYGFINRDFQKTTQDLGTVNGEFTINDYTTLSNKVREERSVLNYIGTLPEQNGTPAPAQGFLNLNPQSRYQVTDVVADQTDVTYKFDTGPIKNTAVAGTEVSRERVSIDSYTGLSSEALGSGAFSGSGTLPNVSVYDPPNTLAFPGFSPSLTGNPTIIPVDTASAYLIETANWRDFIILNGGIRYDDYNVSASKMGSEVSDTTGLVNYNGGIVVKPLPFASLYSAYATSADPVGAELDGTSSTYGGLNPLAPVNQIFGPQTNQAAEAGTKWELFDRRLLATAALFRTTSENARETIPTGQPNAGNIVAGAAYRVQGVDFEVSGKLTDKWSVFGGLVLMNTKVTESAVATDIGLPLANIANQSFNLLSKYKITDQLEFGGQATYRSEIYGGTLLAANQGTVLPAYWRFDAFTEYKIDKNWTAKIFVNNIFNTTYYDAFYQSAAPFVLIAPGRAAYLVVQAKY
jgi:catecholate siderophore receptor